MKKNESIQISDRDFLDEIVTLNITMSRETREQVMIAIFKYREEILQAIEEAKYLNTKYDKLTRAHREQVCKNLMQILGDEYPYLKMLHSLRK